MAAVRSPRCLFSTSKAFYYDNSSDLSRLSFAPYSDRKSSSTRCLLNQNGRARSPIPCNSKARRLKLPDVYSRAKAEASERLAVNSPALLLGFNTIGNLVLYACHNRDTATPFHFNPALLAAGFGALLLMIFGVSKWAKNMGTEKPVDVPIQRRDAIGTTNNIGNRHAPTDNHPTNGVQEGEALPTQRRDGIGTMNNIGNLHAPTDNHPTNGVQEGEALPTQRRDDIGTMNNIGNLHAPTDNHPINGARKGEALPRKKTVNLSVNFIFSNDGDGPNGTIISS